MRKEKYHDKNLAYMTPCFSPSQLQAVVSQMEHQLENGRSPNDPTPITHAPEPNLWAPLRQLHRQSSLSILDPVRRLLSFDEDDEIILIESDQEEELEDDVFVDEEMPNIQDGEQQMAGDTEEEQQPQQEGEVEWEDISDQELTNLAERLDTVNMEQEEEDITDEELHLIGQQYDGMNQSSNIPVGGIHDGGESAVFSHS